MEKITESRSIPRRFGQRPLQRLIHLPMQLLKQAGWVINQFIERVYGLPLARWQPFVLQTLYYLSAAVRLMSKPGESHIYLCKGISKTSGAPLTVQFIGAWKIGEDNSLAYFEQLLFEEGSVERSDLGSCSPGSMFTLARAVENSVDLVAVIANPFLLWVPAYGDWVIGPPGVRMVYDFSPGENWEQIQHRLQKAQEYNFRVLRKNGLAYHTSRHETDLEMFYNCMYLPFITNRYKEHVDAVGMEYARKIFEKPGGSVLLIDSREGQPIAGGLEQVSHGVLYALINGVLDGDYNWVKKGAMTAWYLFEIQRAYELGCRRYDAGQVRPFVNDGLYIHKHRWGFKPQLNYWKPQKILFWSPNSSPAALEWMKAHMFLPQFARAGGPNLRPEYQKLRRETAEEN